MLCFYIKMLIWSGQDRDEVSLCILLSRICPVLTPRDMNFRTEKPVGEHKHNSQQLAPDNCNLS